MGGYAGTNPNRTLQYAFPWMGMGAMPTGYGLYKPHSRPDWTQFGAQHSGGVNFVVADGSVKMVNAQVDTYQFYSSPA